MKETTLVVMVGAQTKDIMKQAVFDHVDDEGNLILTVDGDDVILAITDALEQGILSAKQIKSEAHDANTPPEPATIPISSIQTLVREGHAIAEIAEKYSIAQALVRRFAQPVETEKRYAIAQFLAVNTQTGAATRKLENVITHNLEEAGIDPKAVTWEATKQGRSPWKIVARFMRRDQEYKGTWMWNLRDNSVVSIDPVAKRLLGENASAGTLLFGEEPANTSSRSIQAALNGRGPIPPAWLNDDHDDTAQPATSVSSDSSESSEGTTDEDSVSAQTLETEIVGSPTNDGPQNTESDTTDTDAETPAAQKTAEVAEPTKKRRAAVPSWDDILFGD